MEKKGLRGLSRVTRWPCMNNPACGSIKVTVSGFVSAVKCHLFQLRTGKWAAACKVQRLRKVEPRLS